MCGPSVKVTSLIAVACLITSSVQLREDLHAPDRTNKFHDPKVVQNTEHIKEHLGDLINEETMTPEELEFHYFQLHDTNNDTKLDGLEMYKALDHMNIEDLIKPDVTDFTGKSEAEIHEIQQKHRDEVNDYFVVIIDRILEDDDYDRDGYLSYIEYVLARRRDAARQ